MAGQPLHLVLQGGRQYNLWIFDAGLACCAVEVVAASMRHRDRLRPATEPVAVGPGQADVLVVAGTVTDKLAPAIRDLYEQLPEPRHVLSFGACSNSGGPYWDSYSVTKGVDQLVPVDVYVPGCPPRPEALLHGLDRLQALIDAQPAGLRPGPAHAAPPPAPVGPTFLDQVLHEEQHETQVIELGSRESPPTRALPLAVEQRDLGGDLEDLGGIPSVGPLRDRFWLPVVEASGDGGGEGGGDGGGEGKGEPGAGAGPGGADGDGRDDR